MDTLDVCSRSRDGTCISKYLSFTVEAVIPFIFFLSFSRFDSGSAGG